MKTILRVLFFSLLTSSVFAQLETAKGDTTAATRSTRVRVGVNAAGRVGQKGSTGNFSPFALVSEVTAATGGAVTSVNSKTGPTVSLVTTDIPEGTNQYFTTARANTAGDARYPQLSGSYTNPSWLVSIPFSKLTSTPTTLAGYGITDAQPTIAAGTTAQYRRGDNTWQTLNTSVIPESVNLYYTDTRARAAHSATAPLVYNSSTGGLSMPAATNSVDGYLTATDRQTFAGKANAATTLAGYGITDADPYQTAATYAAMNALTFSANTSRRVLVLADEMYGKTNQWYMVWADGSAVMHADKIVTISEK